MQIKKTVFTFMSLLFLSGVSYSQITLTLPKVSGAPGTSVVSPINVSNLTGLGVTSVQFELKYDPNIILITGVSTAGTLINSPTVVADTINGKLRVAWASAGSLSGSGTLLNINIQFKNLGTTSIKYMVSDSLTSTFVFYSLFGSNLSVNAVDGSAVTNTPPSLNMNPPGPFTIGEGSTLTATLVGSDPDVGDVLTYSYTSNPTITGTSVPTLNSSTGAFSWTPVTNQFGIYNVSFKVSDGKATTTVVTTIKVTKTNLPPILVLNPTGPFPVNEGQKLTITLQGSDPNSGDVLTYSITNPAAPPAGVQLIGNQFTWTPNYNQGSTTPYNFTFKVTDQGGLSASQSSSIYVNKVNRSPVFTKEIPDNLVLTVNIPVPLNFTFQYAAVDPDSDKITFSLINGPDGSTVSPAGLFSWAPVTAQVGQSFTLTVQAFDGIVSTLSSHIISASSKITAVQELSEIPTKFVLYQNYPNPFNPTSSISFAVPTESFIRLSIFDLLGQEVKVLVNRVYSPGNYRISFDASKLNSGIYIYRLETNNFVSSKKMIVLK